MARDSFVTNQLLRNQSLHCHFIIHTTHSATYYAFSYIHTHSLTIHTTPFTLRIFPYISTHTHTSFFAESDAKNSKTNDHQPKHSLSEDACNK